MSHQTRQYLNRYVLASSNLSMLLRVQRIPTVSSRARVTAVSALCDYRFVHTRCFHGTLVERMNGIKTRDLSRFSSVGSWRVVWLIASRDRRGNHPSAVRRSRWSLSFGAMHAVECNEPLGQVSATSSACPSVAGFLLQRSMLYGPQSETACSVTESPSVAFDRPLDPWAALNWIAMPQRGATFARGTKCPLSGIYSIRSAAVAAAVDSLFLPTVSFALIFAVTRGRPLL
jgi:hypothetical protein